ncbi:BQ2448_5959 [Microbotryum intermedium]|uniref:BQ2448_5959 protein n=1 Tax=Microbotryum intermedium TaxID=269621 RepID=A0A238F5W1_9BASI|nr:BQ2448_5959 [Microbotryum intermedium]
MSASTASTTASQRFPAPAPSTAGSKVAGAGPEVNSTANVTKRLSSELMSLMMACPAGISAFPVSDADLTHWKGRIEGAEGTYYENHVYAISLRFPPTYPYAAPTVRFESTCFHPNVDLHGNICLDILKEKWSPMLSVSTILISLQSLLGEPNNKSPLNVQAADLWENAVEVSPVTDYSKCDLAIEIDFVARTQFKKELAKHYKPIVEDE